MATPRVEVTTSGRGGSLVYHEGGRRIDFSWEVAMPPAIALIFGPPAAGWDAAFPWAAGRQEEIYQFVAAEVVRQQVPGGSCSIDLDGGVLEILHAGHTAGRNEGEAAGDEQDEADDEVPRRA